MASLTSALRSDRGRLFFFFNDTATTEIYTLSLHDALPISGPGAVGLERRGGPGLRGIGGGIGRAAGGQIGRASWRGRGEISGGAGSLKKKKKNSKRRRHPLACRWVLQWDQPYCSRLATSVS